jgi:nucleoside-diphosphate-sugar epimerase
VSSGGAARGERELVLLTGATGFIGGRLATRLVAEGRPVRCLVRPGADTSRLVSLGVELAVGDVTLPGTLVDAIAGASRVVHCAAMVSDWATVEEIEAVNVAGTRNLLAAAATAELRRFVHISTTDIYGHPGGNGTIEESHRPSGFSNWYAETKLQAEMEVRRLTALDTVLLRPATVYGPGSKEVVGEIAKAIQRRQMLLVDRGRPVAGLCFVENLIDAAILALDHEAAPGEAFNVTDGLPVTWRRFTYDLAAGLGCPGPRFSLPYRPALALGAALEEAYRLARRGTGLTLPALLSRQAVQVLGRDQRFSNGHARAVLGWEPRVGYEEGMERTLRWLREEHLAAPRPR